MPATVQELDLRRDIGVFSQESLIFQGPNEIRDGEFYSSDVFNTTLVLKEDLPHYDKEVLDYLFNLSQTIDNSINFNAERYPDIRDPHDSEKRAIVRLQSPEYISLKQHYFIDVVGGFIMFLAVGNFFDERLIKFSKSA